MFDSPVETDAGPAAREPAPELSERQRQVLAVVREHMVDHGYPPTVREIGRQLGLTSSSTVHSHLAALERAGMLQRDPTKPRALKVAPERAADAVVIPAPVGGPGKMAARAPLVDANTGVGIDESIAIPVVGQVAAGAPLLADENIDQYLPVPQMLTRSGETFGLRIKGDSMIEAGILDGDYVVVRRQSTAHDGQVVIALVGDDEATCKTLRRRGGKVVLEPANRSISPIIADHIQILGIVTGLLRSF